MTPVVTTDTGPREEGVAGVVVGFRGRHLSLVTHTTGVPVTSFGGRAGESEPQTSW